MKKIFLSCLFFIAFIVLFPLSGVNAQVSCSLKPTKINETDSSVAFEMGPTKPGQKYKIEIDIDKDLLVGCRSNIWSNEIEATGNTVNYTFPKDKSCHDRIFAARPNNYNDIYLNKATGGRICKNRYYVTPACQIDFDPKGLDIHTDLTISGTRVPRDAKVLQITDPSGKKSWPEIQVNPDETFSKTLDAPDVPGTYKLEVLNGYPGDGVGCPLISFGIGPPGKPIQNQPVAPGGNITSVGSLTGQGRCAEGNIDTAIGCIPYTDTNTFIAWFLKWAIGIAGGIAFLMIIFSGFQIMTSSNNPQQLQTGRELLTGAVSGLILIIFSAVLLKLIGVDILGIPGL